MAGENTIADLAERLSVLERRLGERFDALERQTEALERRLDHIDPHVHGTELERQSPRHRRLPTARQAGERNKKRRPSVGHP